MIDAFNRKLIKIRKDVWGDCKKMNYIFKLSFNQVLIHLK